MLFNNKKEKKDKQNHENHEPNSIINISESGDKGQEEMVQQTELISNYKENSSYSSSNIKTEFVGNYIPSKSENKKEDLSRKTEIIRSDNSVRIREECEKTELVGLDNLASQDKTELIESENIITQDKTDLYNKKQLNMNQTELCNDNILQGTVKTELFSRKQISSESPLEKQVKTRKPVQKVSFILRLLDKENGGRVFEKIITDVLVIGRKSELCDLAISYDKTVSSRQCKVFIKRRRLYVTDLGGTNITYLNGKPLNEEVVLNSGDVLSLGRINLRVTITKNT